MDISICVTPCGLGVCWRSDVSFSLSAGYFGYCLDRLYNIISIYDSISTAITDDIHHFLDIDIPIRPPRLHGDFHVLLHRILPKIHRGNVPKPLLRLSQLARRTFAWVVPAAESHFSH